VLPANVPLPGRRRSDSEGDSSDLRALIVDYDPSVRAFLAVLLRRFGFKVAQVTDGAEAVALIDQREFDLMVIDCEMPMMSGLELIHRVRASEHCRDTYALMLTAREDTETKLNALQNGFDDFICKSLPEVELAATLVAARRIITRQHKLDSTVRELYGLATRDELTGLHNRRFFFTEAEHRLAHDPAVSVVLFDLDGFKQINDTYGHLAGDRVLRDCGALFYRSTRQEDLIARYGGDEFVMLVASGVPLEIERIAQRMANQIASLQWSYGGDPFHVSACTGYAISTLLETPTLELLLNACDRDLYKNKWLRTHPDVDPSLYEYDQSRSGRLSDLIDFPAAGDKAAEQQS